MVEQNAGQLKTIAEKVDKVLETVTPKKIRTPKKRSPNKAQILSDPVPKTMCDTIIHASKPKACHRLRWALFQVTATFFFFTGQRIFFFSIKKIGVC